MRFLIFFYTIWMVLGLTACQKTTTTQQQISKTEIIHLAQQCDEYLNVLTTLGQFNGVVLIEKNGKTILKKAYNLSSKPLDSLPSLWVTPDKQFDLRSISKLFAKASIIKLEQQGKLHRKDLLNKYIPDFPNGNKITLEHLMHNRSGLPREFTTITDCLDKTSEEIIELAKKEKLEFEPNTDERYSNVGFQLLYIIIAQVSQKSYANYLKQGFFDPLNMKTAGGHFDFDVSTPINYAYGHYKKDDLVIPVLTFPQEDCRTGHLYASVDDLLKFINYLGEEPYFSALQHEGKIGHAGGSEGKRAYVFKHYQHNYAFTFLCNYDEIPFQQLSEDLKKILESKPYQIPQEITRKEVKLSQQQLSNYTGIYDFAELEHLQLHFIVENEQLTAYQNGQRNGVLYAENDSTFFWDKKSAESVIFQQLDSITYKALLDFKGARWEGIQINSK